MRVYLMQHGKPVSKQENPDKPLSDAGKKDVESMAEFLSKCGVGVDFVFHSGKTRTKETADIMALKLNPGLEPQARERLSPIDDVSAIAEEVNISKKDLLIAGHLPHLGKLVAFLITGNDTKTVVRFQQGGVVCLEKDPEGQWGVVFMIVPEIIRQIE